MLHVVPAFYPTRGGIEVLLENLLPELHNTFGVDSEVIAPRHRQERDDDCERFGIRVHSVDLVDARETRNIPKELAQVFARVRSVILQVNPDILHIHAYSPLALAAANVARAQNIRTVLHIHGGVDAPLPPHFLRLVAQVPSIVAVSEFVKSTVTKVTGRTEEIYVIPNGIRDLNGRQYADESSGSLNVCMVGRLEPEKGFAWALEALANSNSKDKLNRIEIVGAGGEIYRLQEVARRGNLGRLVRFHGELKNEDAVDVIAHSHLTVIPSLSVEGFSLVALESALLSKPVVASRVGGLPETIGDGLTGTLVKPNDTNHLRMAIDAYLESPRLRHLHGNAARIRALERFTLDRMTQGIFSHYESLVGKDWTSA